MIRMQKGAVYVKPEKDDRTLNIFKGWIGIYICVHGFGKI